MASPRPGAYIPQAHSWRTVTAGLNLEGRCASELCLAEDVIVGLGFVRKYDFNTNRRGLVCPRCCRPLTQVNTCLFGSVCQWTIQGLRAGAAVTNTGVVENGFVTVAARGWMHLKITAERRISGPGSQHSHHIRRTSVPPRQRPAWR